MAGLSTARTIVTPPRGVKKAPESLVLVPLVLVLKP